MYPSTKTYGPWIIDTENVIKRQIFDDDGNYCGYELLDGDYTKLSAMHNALKATALEWERTQCPLNNLGPQAPEWIYLVKNALQAW